MCSILKMFGYTKNMFSILKTCLEIHVSMVWDMQCFLRLLHLTISEVAGFRNPPVLGHIESVTSGGLEVSIKAYKKHTYTSYVLHKEGEAPQELGTEPRTKPK